MGEFIKQFINHQLFKLKMPFQIENKTIKWLIQLQIISQNDVKPITTSTSEIKDSITNLFQNGVKVSLIVQEICKKRGLPISQTLNHLKLTNQTAAQLYNWNIINEILRKLDCEIDAQTKNLIINGDREHLGFVIRKLHNLYESNADEMEDSLQTAKLPKQSNTNRQDNGKNQDSFKESLTLSKSQDQKITGFTKDKAKQSQIMNLQKMRNPQPMQSTAYASPDGDLIEYIINELIKCLKLTKKQAVALLSDNNKYLAHVLVKGVKGQFGDIEQLMQRWYSSIDYIVQKMLQQNDMCFFFLQIVKPTLLSKSEEIAQWGCRILSKVAYELANKEMLPLAYDWFVRQAGGLSTTILALSRHPKLNQHVVSYILQFARFNVTQLFTIELKKITNNDNLAYIKFMLLIFDPLVQSKISSEQLLNSGAIDYWVQISLKGAESSNTNTIQLRLFCLQFLTKIWRAYPIHIQQTMDKVNEIMNYIKRGTRQNSEIMKFSLVQLLFNLLDEFAAKKNPFASIVYKKLTFLFIETHQQLTMREFMLRNLSNVFSKYQSIPVEIFLEPFIKQIKTRESKSYFVNIFDMEFINVVTNHKKLKVAIGLELFDLLAKTKLNSYSFATFADEAMSTLLDRFLDQDIFFQYTVKLVKISLATFYSTLKHKKQFDDSERLQAQKRAEIINFIVSLIERSNADLNEEIKNLVIHVKIQIQNKLGTTHKGIQKILSMFNNIQQAIMEALQNMKDETESNATSQTQKSEFHLPKLDSKYIHRDQTSSQQSFQSQGTKYSRGSRQQFPIKDYTAFAEQDQKKFLKENGIGLKKKIKEMKKVPSQEKEVIDPKIQQNLIKIKEKKEEQQRKKLKEQQMIHKRAQLLKNKIQKELEQRNLMQGLKGNEKDVQTKVIFDENEINQKLFEDEDDLCKNTLITEEENRDSQSIKIVLRRYNGFIRKIFSKFACAKMNKKDYFEGENDNMALIDLIRLCKEKNIEKNKQTITQIVRTINDKNIKNLTVDAFFKFLEGLCIYSYLKQKCNSHYPMGDHMKNILKRVAAGQNIKLDEDQDQQCKIWTEKIHYNPHIQLPDSYKKINERVYDTKRQCSYPVKKAVKNEKYIACYEVVNDLLAKIFKFHILEEEVRFNEESRVILKKNNILPPKPIKKEKEESQGIALLEDKEAAPINFKTKRAASNANKQIGRAENLSVEKENSKPKQKILNAAEKKKIEEQEARRLIKQQEDEKFKIRQQQLKKKMERQQQNQQREKSKKKEETKAAQDQQQQKKRKQKEQKEKYLQKQKQKVEKYKKEQQEKEREQKQKQKEQRLKQQQQNKEKYKLQMKKEQEKRKEQLQKAKRQKQLAQEQNRKKKQEQQKKKEQLKKQVLKKLEGQKQKYEIGKLFKELLKKVYQQQDIANLFNQYKQQLRSLFNFGKQFNEYKLGDMSAQNYLQAKGWISICQQMNICDVATANNIIKMNQKEKGRSGLSYEEFLQVLLNLNVKKEIEGELQDYDKAHKACFMKMDKFLKGMKIPKDKQGIKEYFITMKNNQRKRQESQMQNSKKEEIQVQNPNGERQTWELQ